MLTLPENHVASFALNGYLLVEDAFDPEPVRLALDHHLKLHLATGGGIVSGGYRPDVAMDPVIQSLYTDEVLLDFAKGVLCDEPAFGSLGANIVPGNSPGMDAHVDYPYFSMAKMPSSHQPALCVQMIWYLEDVTEDFAPTVVAPESHLRPSKPHQDYFREIATPVLAKAGSLFIGHGALWHAVMPNKTDRNRPVVLGSFLPYWVRPMLRPALPDGLSPRMRRLMCSNFGERIGKDYERNSVKL